MRLLITTFFLFSLTTLFSQTKPLLVNSGEVIADGIKYYDDEKYDKAINKYKQVAESDTNYALSLYELGLSYLAQKNYTLAIATFQEGLKLESDLRSAFIQQLGNTYSSNKQLDKALETYRNGLKEYPMNFRYYYEIGAAFYDDKQPKVALQYLDSCLKINFGYPRAHLLMGLICAENNYFVPALMSFQMASYLGYDSKIGLLALTEIQKIATGETRVNSKDSIVKLFDKSDNNFEDLEEIIKSKSELDPKYKVKPSVSLPFTAVIKCLHVMNSRLVQITDAKGWYAETLMPIYAEWWNNGEFPIMMYRMCNSTDKEAAQKMYKKNKEAITQQYTRFYSHFLKKKIIYESMIPQAKGEYKHLFLYDNNSLYAMIPSSEPYSLSKGLSPRNGYYIFFYNNGNIKKEGSYIDGVETGTWKYYFETGVLNQIYEVTSPTDYTYTKYYSNGQPEEKGHLVDQKTVGKFYRYYRNGLLEKVIPVGSNDKVEGDFEKYFDNGQLKEIITFANSKIIDGERIQYYRNGAISTKENFKNEKLDGEWTEYFKSGQIRQYGKYKAGKLEGPWKKYHPNGKIALESNYVNGELHGVYKEYYDSGVLESEANYVNGDNSGKTIHYDTDGKKYAEYVENRGKIKSATYFDKNGKAIHQVDMAKSETPFVKYNMLGIKVEEGSALKDMRYGTWKFYYNSGALSTTKDFDNKGKVNGKVEEYYEGGNLKKRYEMNDDMLDGTYTGYYFNGKKYEEGTYVKDMKQGIWRKYYSNGVVSDESYYLNDEVVGIEKSFYRNGNLRSYEEYKDGVYIKYSLFDTSGQLISMDTIGLPYGDLILKYKNSNTYVQDVYWAGMLQGKQTSYWGNKNPKNIQERSRGAMVNVEYDYYTNGKLKEVTFYKYGQIDSIHTSYYENGNIEQQFYYKYGEANGPEIYYQENGKVEVKGERKDGEKEGWYEFYAPDGHIQYRVKYHLGVAIAYSYQDKDGKYLPDIQMPNASGDFTCTFSNGITSAKGSYVNGERHGLYTKYYFNGKKCFETSYDNGYINGTYINYYENGKTLDEVTYVNNSKEGVEKKYDEKGNLVLETTWLNDIKHGPEKYYSGGKLVKTINYEYGNTYEK